MSTALALYSTDNNVTNTAQHSDTPFLLSKALAVGGGIFYGFLFCGKLLVRDTYLQIFFK